MINIDIDKNKRTVVIKEIQNNKTIINKFGNISINGADGILVSVKLVIFAITKIFIYHKNYADKEFMFYINDPELIKLIKSDTNDIYKKINFEWHTQFNNKTVSELGRLLSMFKKLPSKDILCKEANENFTEVELNLILKRDGLIQEQSICDKKLQDVLHKIEYGHYNNAEKVIENIRRLRIQRSLIKKNIKNIDIKLCNLSKNLK